jgi:glycosyltransferase involved in cell wall biosynthesis
MSSPLVTVVSPLYNAERFVRSCMQSVLAQTYDNWRYFVLDNACTDRTGDIARELAATDPRVTVVRNDSTVPVMQNHNLAVGLTPPESTYMRILQGDDVLHPRCLEQSVAVAEQNPRIGMVGSHIRWGDAITSNEFDPGRNHFDGREVARRTLLGETYPFLSPSAILFRWEAVAARRPFYDEVRLHGDVMAAYEVLRDWDFGMVHEVLTTVGSNDASVTSTVSQSFNKLLGSNLDLLMRYGDEFLNPAEMQARVDHSLARYYEFLGFAWLGGREAAFWQHHENALRDAGLPLSRPRLLRQIARNVVAEPRRSARGVYRRFFPGAQV